MIFRRDRLALLVVALALAACSGPADEPTPVERARAELAAGRPLDAQILLEKQLAQGADRTELAAYLGEAALALGNLDEAGDWLGGGAFSESSMSHGLRMRGRLALARGDLPGAAKAFDASYAVWPDNPDLWVDIGRLRYRGGEQLQAIAAADKAVQLAPQNPGALQFRGQLARDAQGLLAGAAWFARALEIQPDNVDLRVEYAATLGDAGMAREALAALRGDDGRAANSPRGFFVQAVIAARAGYDLLARQLLERSGLERESVPAALMLSALTDLQAGNYASATQTLDRLQRMQPDNERVVDLLAYALSSAGRDRELVYRFAERAHGALGTVYLRTLVGRSYEALEDRARAAQFLDLAALANNGLAVIPGPVGHIVSASGGSGLETRDFVRDALSGRRSTAAVQRARDFTRRFPGSGDAYGILGDAEFAEGNKRAAREAYMQSAAVRRPWPLTLRLAQTQPDRGRARELLEAYVRNNPANGEAAAILADAYASEGKWDKAALQLDHAMGLGQGRVPWVLAARSVTAAQLDDPRGALDWALAAYALQPLNPQVNAALIASLPREETVARGELLVKLRSLIRN